MFKINNNEFTLLNKYKLFINELDNLIENIPRKDYFYKDKIRVVSNLIIELILKLNYDEDNISYYKTNIKGNIAYLDWNALTGDSEKSNPSPEYLMQNLQKTTCNKNSVVILMHDAAAKKITADMLPQVIEYLKQQGYEFKTFSDLLGDTKSLDK